MAIRLAARLRDVWCVLRHLSGDDAYERYLEHYRLHHPESTPPLDRARYYRLATQRKWNGIRRCC